MALDWKILLEIGQAILITGHKREGKSALAWYLLWLANRIFKLPCYVIGVPPEKWQYFPPFAKGLVFEDKDDFNLPEDAAIFIEEAALIFYARAHGKDINKVVSAILGATGQKGQIVIFATHHTRKLDVSVVMDMDIWALKRPTKWHIRFERRELRKIVAEAYEHFSKVTRFSDESYELAIVYGNDHEGIPVTNTLPLFWTPELSNVFRDVNLFEAEDGSEASKITTSTKYPMERHLQLFGAKAVKPPKPRVLTNEELNTAELLLKKAASALAKGKVDEALPMIEESLATLTPPMGGILSSPRSPLSEREEGEIAAVMAKWTIFETVGSKTALPTMSWVAPILAPENELTEVQEDSVKRTSIYVKGGLTIHFNEVAHNDIHVAIAKQFGVSPESLYDNPQPSPLEDFEWYYSFDLTRKKDTKGWMAAGGRIIPTELIKDLQELDTEQIGIVIDPVYAEDLA